MLKQRSAILSMLFCCFVLLSYGQSVERIGFDVLEKWMTPDVNDEKVYVINFWATWCKPCVEEMPYFEALHGKHKEASLEVILVSLDFPSQLEKRVIPFVEKRNLQPKVVLLDAGDPNKWIDKVDRSWSGAIPATMFIKGGKRVFVEDSFHDVESLEEIIHSL